MPRGRKPDPPQLRLLKGSGRTRRAGSAPQPAAPPEVTDADRAQAPATLTDAELRYFDELVETLTAMRIPSAPHVRLLELAAQRRAEIDELTALIREQGPTYRKAVFDDEGNDTGEFLIKPNPAVRMRSEAQRHLHALLAEMGLTPSASGRISASVAAPRQSRFARFLGSG